MMYNSERRKGEMTDYEKPSKGKPPVLREAAAAYGQQARAPGGEWVSAADFKAHCLALIDKVRQERGEVVVTRYGKPVARLVPYEAQAPSIFGFLAGAVTRCGDLVSPLGEAWDADA
jgi:prevent-host-death family protein